MRQDSLNCQEAITTGSQKKNYEVEKANENVRKLERRKLHTWFDDLLMFLSKSYLGHEQNEPGHEQTEQGVINLSDNVGREVEDQGEWRC